jgi:hypothetical protein
MPDALASWAWFDVHSPGSEPPALFLQYFLPFPTGLGYKWSLKISREQDLHRLKRYKTSFGTR